MSHKWTAIERDILSYFAQHLHGTKKIVTCLGKKVLDPYMRLGYIEKDVIDKLKDLHVYND